MLQTVPFISPSERHREVSKNCKCYLFLSGRGREFFWCITEKNLPDIRLLPKELLTHIRVGNCIKRRICVPQVKKGASDEILGNATRL